MIISIIGAIISWLIFRKYLIKRHQLTLYLFIIFACFVIAVIFSWISKIIVLTTDIDYVYNQSNVRFPNTPLYWLLFRIVDFRISILFVAIAVIYSYLLKVGIFEKDPSKNQKVIVFVFGGYVIFFTVFIYERGNTLLDAINFLNILIFMAAIYISFIIRLLKAYRTVNDPTFKRAFLSLAIMSLSFILTFIFVLIDRITIIMGSQGFTIFYFLAWSFVIVGFLGAYLGYIRPKSTEE
ncbi:MAG: hypothetical protein ACFFHV_15155 [Promethearchaeota archaeon]